MLRLPTLALLAATSAAAAPAGPRTIHDDYARALAEARTRQVPLVVDVWAPW